MRLIDADKLKAILYNIANTMQDNGYSSYAGALGEAANIVENRPTVDAVPVVRCKDCLFRGYVAKGMICCLQTGQVVLPNGFCNWGEKMDGGTDNDTP